MQTIALGMLRLADPERSNGTWQVWVLLGCEVWANIYLGSVKSPSSGTLCPQGYEVSSRLPCAQSPHLSVAANGPSHFPLKLRELTLLQPSIYLAQCLMVYTQDQALGRFTDSTSWRHLVGGEEAEAVHSV